VQRTPGGEPAAIPAQPVSEPDVEQLGRHRGRRAIEQHLTLVSGDQLPARDRARSWAEAGAVRVIVVGRADRAVIQPRQRGQVLGRQVLARLEVEQVRDVVGAWSIAVRVAAGRGLAARCVGHGPSSRLTSSRFRLLYQNIAIYATYFRAVSAVSPPALVQPRWVRVSSMNGDAARNARAAA